MALFYYLIIVNLCAGCAFVYDKWASGRKKARISERLLHGLELLGGVFADVVLMYVIRHKNRKFSFYAVTYCILLGWVAFLLMM